MSNINSSLKQGQWASSYKTNYYPIPKQDLIINIEINIVTFIIELGAQEMAVCDMIAPIWKNKSNLTQYGIRQKTGFKHYSTESDGNSRGETFIDCKQVYSQQSHILGVRTEGQVKFHSLPNIFSHMKCK